MHATLEAPDAAATPPGLPLLEPVEEAGRAELLLHPLRQRILAEARRPTTAAEIARRIDLPPQKVNYHVRTLIDAGFLTPAGEGLKRNLVEKRYRASARSYLLLPQVLGDMGPGAPDDADRFSAAYLMHLSARLQRELGAWLESTDAGAPVGDPEDVPTLSLDAEVRFDSAAQRAAFADALQRAVTEVIGRHTSPARGSDGEPRQGRPFRLVVGCYPLRGPSAEDPASRTEEPGAR